MIQGTATPRSRREWRDFDRQLLLQRIQAFDSLAAGRPDPETRGVEGYYAHSPWVGVIVLATWRAWRTIWGRQVKWIPTIIWGVVTEHGWDEDGEYLSVRCPGHGHSFYCVRFDSISRTWPDVYRSR